jgi:hypothetical protein
MLIDQMKEHPEEFRGYGAKFIGMLDMARDANQGLQRNVKMSQRDAAAILAAAETHLYEVWLAEDVLTTIMQPKVEAEEPKYKVGLTPAHIANTALNSIYTNSNLSNLSTDQYAEQAYQREMARHKLELEKQRLQDQDYAMRNTKPFKFSI